MSLSSVLRLAEQLRNACAIFGVPAVHEAMTILLLLSGLPLPIRAIPPGGAPGPRSLYVRLPLHYRCLPSLVLLATTRSGGALSVMLCEVTNLMLCDKDDAV